MFKRIALAVAALLMLLVLVVVVFIWRFDLDSYRDDVEVLLNEQTGLEFVINGGLEFRQGKPLQLSASDVSINHAGKTLVNFERLSLDFDWRPLFDRQLIIDDILLQSAQINLSLDSQGDLVFPEFPASKAPEQTVHDGGSKLPLNTVRIEKIRILAANLVLQQDRAEDQPVAIVENLDLVLESLALVQDAEVTVSAWPEYLSNVSLQAQLTIEGLRYAQYQLSEVKALTHNKGQTLVTDLSLKVLGAALESDLQFDWQQTQQALRSDVSIRGLQLPQLAKLLELEQTLQGELDIDWQGGSQAKQQDDWLKALKGELAIRGDQLGISGFDLNKLLSNLQQSQELDLVDVGGLALAGPIGLLLTKGGDFGSIISAASTGDTTIRQLNMEWGIAEHNAHFKDVAIATDAKRLVLTGDFGLAGYTFDPVTLYLVNAEGCDVFKQQIKGSVEKPEVSAMAFAAKSLLNPVTSLVEKTVDVIAKCEPVYSGKVDAPPEVKPADTETSGAAPSEETPAEKVEQNPSPGEAVVE